MYSDMIRDEWKSFWKLNWQEVEFYDTNIFGNNKKRGEGSLIRKLIPTLSLSNGWTRLWWNKSNLSEHHHIQVRAIIHHIQQLRTQSNSTPIIRERERENETFMPRSFMSLHYNDYSQNAEIKAYWMFHGKICSRFAMVCRLRLFHLMKLRIHCGPSA
jgi:hypothetical protein